MRMRRSLAAVVMGLAVAGFSGFTAAAQDLNVPYVAPRPASTLVMLPDGSTVHVELATTEAEKAYGLMGRTKLPEGRGMLFINREDAQVGYWMYHCKIALDIIWIAADHRIVEMSPNTPPCLGKSSTCPTYGGHEPYRYALELPAGDISRHHLQVGETIDFSVDTQGTGQ